MCNLPTRVVMRNYMFESIRNKLIKNITHLGATNSKDLVIDNCVLKNLETYNPKSTFTFRNALLDVVIRNSKLLDCIIRDVNSLDIEVYNSLV